MSNQDDRSSLLQFLLSGPELSGLEVTPLKEIVIPWLTLPCLVLIHAMRGIGKSFFALTLADCISKGKAFLSWVVTEPMNVLYLDGEMPMASLKKRYGFISGGVPSEALSLLPSEHLWPKQRLNLNEEESQNRVQVLLDQLTAMGKRPAVIILDNLSCLTYGIDESNNSQQDSLITWLIGLRHQGFTVIVIHHSGKNGDQRGASRREDPSDAVMKLVGSRTEQQAGASFEVVFTKQRNVECHIPSVYVELRTGEQGEAVWNLPTKVPKSGPQSLRALKLIEAVEPKTVTDLGTVMGITRQAAKKHVNALRAKGLLEEDSLVLTEAGREILDDL